MCSIAGRPAEFRWVYRVQVQHQQALHIFLTNGLEMEDVGPWPLLPERSFKSTAHQPQLPHPGKNRFCLPNFEGWFWESNYKRESNINYFYVNMKS